MLETLIIVLVILIAVLINLIVIYWCERVNVAHAPLSLRLKCKIKRYRFNKRKVYVINNRKSTKRNSKKKKVMLYMHGGAYITNITKDHWRLFENIVNEKDYTIIVPDYPLLPANNYEDVFEFVTELYDKITDNLEKSNINKEDIIMMGDSAGGGIALAFCEKLYVERKIQQNKLILISPWLDASLNNEDIIEVQKRDKVLNYKPLKLIGEIYSNFGKLDNYLVSPLYGNVSGIKNLVIFIGTNDILYPDVIKLEEKINKHKKNNKLSEEEYPKVKVIVGKGMEHIWLLLKKYRTSKEYKIMLGEIKNEK